VRLIRVLIAVLLVSRLFVPVADVYAQAETDVPVVHAILFYSPTCGHCEYVINEILLPLVDKYGEQLQIIAIDVTQPEGQTHFLSATDQFDLQEAGVPFLVIGETYLIGSEEIPGKFPGLVESYLAQGGVDWPNIPGLTESLKETQNTTKPTPATVPVVHAVLFYRSTCSHCRQITEEVIPPLFEKYGAQLEIFGIDVSLPEGDALYDQAIESFNIERLAVPTLILGENVLIGGEEIQESVAGLIEGFISQGGADWPAITGLNEAISKASQAEASPATPMPTNDSQPSSSLSAPAGILLMNHEPINWTDRFAQDLAGNTIAVLVLLAMLASITWAASLFKKTNKTSIKENWAWVIPLLCIIGFGVAGYLAYVETSEVAAICGPVGDCNTVQQSEYARLFGILPIGVLGLMGYTTIFILWLVARYGYERIAELAAISSLGLTVLGTLFSIYLTFLEPFVIGATCAWCLTSAVLMTILMLVSVKPAKIALLKQQ
jgi:uncharacterized membrane protein/thiol-disulfide isomerase/thioredoxin